MPDPTFASAVALAKLYRARKVSPLEVVQAALARIDQVNPRVTAVVTLVRDAALADARRATAALRRRGAPLPPLFGVPVAIKDVTQTKGIRTTFLTYAFSVMGLPAISIPCGFTAGGLPIGLQIVGRRRGEAAVLRAAAAFEAAAPWLPHVPPVVRA